MSKTLLISAYSTGSGGTTKYGPVGNCWQSSQNLTSTEALAQTTWRSSGTFSLLRVYCSIAAAATITVVFRVNGADGNMTVTVPSSTTGEFIDSSNTDSVSVGDEVAYKYSGGTVELSVMECTFEADSNTVARNTAHSNAFAALAASTTYYAPTGGRLLLTTTTEALTQVECGLDGTQRNLFVYVWLNSRTTTTTFRNRINGSNGSMSIAVGSTATGIFEDTTNSDTLSQGDLINYSFTTGTGTQSASYTILSSEIVTTDGNAIAVMGGNPYTVSEGQIRYCSFGGGGVTPSSTEERVKSEITFTGTASYLFVYVDQNTLAGSSGDETCEWIVRKNGVTTSLQVSVPRLTTGTFTNTSDTVDFDVGDDINYRCENDSNSLFTSARFRTASCCFQDTSGGVVLFLRAMMGVGL